MISVSGPQMDVSWSVNPMNTVRSIINHSQNGVMFFFGCTTLSEPAFTMTSACEVVLSCSKIDSNK